VKSMTLALASIVAVTLAGAGIASGGGSSLAKSGTCPLVAGVKWVLPYAPYTSGTKYDLHVGGTKITCKQAAGYVRKLVTLHIRKSGPLSGGPKGFKCTASPGRNGLAYTGTCQPTSEGFLPRDYFTWTVG